MLKEKCPVYCESNKIHNNFLFCPQQNCVKQDAQFLITAPTAPTNNGASCSKVSPETILTATTQPPPPKENMKVACNNVLAREMQLQIT
jgi:hypothetical protein